jgi:hemerythrin
MTPRPFFSWKPEFVLGIPDVDAEHERFFQLVNELYVSMVRGDGEQQQGSSLRSLLAYAAFHFEREEALLDAVHYPGVGTQRKQHQWFVEYLERQPTETSGASRAALGFAKDWMLEHILGTDKQYSVWLASRTFPVPPLCRVA